MSRVDEPGGVFRHMTSKQAPSILILILGSATVFAQEKPQVPEMTPARAGQEVFETYCAVCHGTDAKGHGSAAPGLKKHPTDLTQLSRRNGGRFPTQIVSSVIQGNDAVTDHGTRDMPMWGDAFHAVNHDDTLVRLKIRNLTAYIESIQQK